MIHLHTPKDVVGYEGRYAMAFYNMGGGGNPPRNGLTENQYYIGKILEGGYFHVLKPDRMCCISEFLSYRLVSKYWSELSNNEQSLLVAAYNQKKVTLTNFSSDMSLQTRNMVAKSLYDTGYIRWTDEEQTIELTVIGEVEVHRQIFNINATDSLTESNSCIRIQHHTIQDHEIDLAQQSTLTINLDGMHIRILALPKHGAVIRVEHDSANYIHLGRIDRDKSFAQVYIDSTPLPSNIQIIDSGDKMTDKDIYLTTLDIERLQKLFSDPNLKQQKLYLEKLKGEIERAIVVDPSNILGDVVTMNSRVCLVDVDTNEEMIVTLVYPENANMSEAKISILAPIGTAILGYSQGEIVQWEVPDGTRSLRIDRILYQPEAVREFHL